MKDLLKRLFRKLFQPKEIIIKHDDNVIGREIFMAMQNRQRDL